MKDERGFALVLTAICGFGFILMLGFGVDCGAWYLNAMKLQRASDAASLAGAEALPNLDQANIDAVDSLSRNGYVDGVNNITVTTTATGDRFSTEVADNHIQMYFLSGLLPQLSMHRISVALRSNAAPALGSPYNVFGTGNLDIPGIPRQNFWLAVNSLCDAKEDGDYFSSLYDSNKGPYTSTLNGNNFAPVSGGSHHCKPADVIAGQFLNPDYNKGGYSYFVDIPKPAHIGDSVDIEAYDAEYDDGTDVDVDTTMDGDEINHPATMYEVWNTNGTPDDESDDTPVSQHGILAFDARVGKEQWLTLATVPYVDIPDTGGQYRIQVSNVTPAKWVDANTQVGADAFALGAFTNGVVAGCDSRVAAQITCPRVYGRNAVSVLNNLSSASAGGTVSYYFAEVDTSYIGKPFTVELWDPGEGVSSLALLGPDGTKLPFTWDSAGMAGGSGTDLSTSGIGPLNGPNLSNNYLFNDRLVQLHVTLPATYADMVTAANNDKWLRIQYTVGSTNSDRTTWGISMTASPGSPPHLTRPG